MNKNINLSNEEKELLLNSIIYELERVKHLKNTKIRYNSLLLQQLMPELLDTRSDLVKYLDLSELKLDTKKTNLNYKENTNLKEQEPSNKKVKKK